eukprot:TRINITY_DN598_c0_g1_i1.p1 TRINITY_DN598_c0_g1~~TRINITY_DN598_c0_g1_i1.p1  ORF type:complete len:113 (+),score=31.24 TRINITY_DN598_c0_g1_i1:65-403(+)
MASSRRTWSDNDVCLSLSQDDDVMPRYGQESVPQESSSASMVYKFVGDAAVVSRSVAVGAYNVAHTVGAGVMSWFGYKTAGTSRSSASDDEDSFELRGGEKFEVVVEDAFEG